MRENPFKSMGDGGEMPTNLKELAAELREHVKGAPREIKLHLVRDMIKLISVTLRIVDKEGQTGVDVTVDAMAKFLREEMDAQKFSEKEHGIVLGLLFPSFLLKVGLIEKKDNTYLVTRNGFAHILSDIAASSKSKSSRSNDNPTWGGGDLNNLV